MDKPHSSSPQPDASSTIEQLSAGLTREWLNDRQIVVYTVKDVRHETVDAWTEAFKSDIQNWPADRLLRVMHDLRVAGGITPYGRARAQEMFHARAEVSVWAAVVLPPTFVNDLIRLFVRTQAKATAARIREFFTTRDEALKWLSR